jgi:hypothetical protein
MARSRLTRRMLAEFPRERDVVSYAPGLDERGHIFVLKFMLKNNQEDIVFLPSAVAFHIRNSLRDASRKHRYRDVRRKVGESQPEPQIIQDFLDRQPALAGDDRNALAGQAPRLVKGCEVHAFKDAIFFGFMITDDILCNIPASSCDFVLSD